MRITNKIMERNSISNINKNKELQDKLSTQMATQKKISKASDDPVVAIRALRLRSNVTEISQYYEKNIPDAESWLNITEDALKNLSDVLTNMIEQCTKGANGDLTSSDRQIILEQLTALSDEVYVTGDADYAGRYVFAGYRTDTPLSFQNAANTHYTIKEQLNREAMDTVNFVNTGDLKTWTSANFDGLTASTENDISYTQVNRIRLAYDNLDGATVPEVEYYAGVKDADGNPVMSALSDTYPITNAKSSDQLNGLDPYTYVSRNDNAVVFLADTGELLLGANAYDALMQTRDDASTSAIDESEIRITYDKTKWNGDDLRPEHYFYCESTDDEGNVTLYNESYLNGIVDKQAITYDVGFNQTLQVNSTADECFKLGIGREVDDLVKNLQQVVDLETLKTQMENKLNATPESDTVNRKLLQTQLSAVGKALTYARDYSQKSFEKGITTIQNFLNDTNLAITNLGTRSSKLELIQNRTQNQKTTFETLRSENEDVDITEVAIDLTSAETTYEAALMSTGKIMQHTLLDYI